MVSMDLWTQMISGEVSATDVMNAELEYERKINKDEEYEINLEK